MTEEVMFARFLATQYIRTQKYREQSADGVQALLKLMREQPDKAREELRVKSDFMKEQSKQKLQSWHMSIVSQRLNALQLPKEERDKVMPELDELLEQFYKIEASLAEHSADFLEGNFLRPRFRADRERTRQALLVPRARDFQAFTCVNGAVLRYGVAGS